MRQVLFLGFAIALTVTATAQSDTAVVLRGDCVTFQGGFGLAVGLGPVFPAYAPKLGAIGAAPECVLPGKAPEAVSQKVYTEAGANKVFLSKKDAEAAQNTLRAEMVKVLDDVVLRAMIQEEHVSTLSAKVVADVTARYEQRLKVLEAQIASLQSALEKRN